MHDGMAKAVLFPRAPVLRGVALLRELVARRLSARHTVFARGVPATAFNIIIFRRGHDLPSSPDDGEHPPAIMGLLGHVRRRSGLRTSWLMYVERHHDQPVVRVVLVDRDGMTLAATISVAAMKRWRTRSGPGPSVGLVAVRSG